MCAAVFPMKSHTHTPRLASLFDGCIELALLLLRLLCESGPPECILSVENRTKASVNNLFPSVCALLFVQSAPLLCVYVCVHAKCPSPYFLSPAFPIFSLNPNLELGKITPCCLGCHLI